MITSRERVKNAIARKPNDRVPYDFRAEPEVYDKIKLVKGFAANEEVRLWAKSDVRDLSLIFADGGFGGYSGFGWRDKVLDDGSQEDFWGVRRKRVDYEGGSYVDIYHWPLRDLSPDQVRAYEWPDPEKIFDFTSVKAKIDSLNRGNEYWYMFEVESLFDRCWAMRGMEQFMSDLLSAPETADCILSGMADFFYKRTEMLLREARGCLDAVGMYNDLGTQASMMISPKIYREFIKPKQKRLIELIKSYGVTVFYHSCGAIEPVIEDLIEIGVDILDPLQTAAMGVSPEHLADTYGDRVVFHGALNTQSFMSTARPEEVQAEVKHLVETLGKGGGFILSGSHYYQVDIPVENLEAVHCQCATLV